jgi:hypothetical protein
MPNTSVDLQSALVARLRGDTNVTALCPADCIFDRSMRPEKDVCVILGEGDINRYPLTLHDDSILIYPTLHLWNRAQDFALVKNLGDAIRTSFRARFAGVVRFAFKQAHYMRDPGGNYVHGVLTFSALIQEVVQFGDFDNTDFGPEFS